MTKAEIDSLMPGDVVQHKDGEAFVVICQAYSGHRAVAVRTLTISNPDEWEKVYKNEAIRG